MSKQARFPKESKTRGAFGRETTRLGDGPKFIGRPLGIPTQNDRTRRLRGLPTRAEFAAMAARIEEIGHSAVELAEIVTEAK